MTKYREIYRAEQLPVTQNRMFTTQSEALNCVKSDVVLVQDMETGFIFNRAFNAKLIEYDSDYQNEQANSFAFRNHLDEVTKIIQRYFLGKSLVEIGCGKGFFLEHLLSKGFDVKGIDPAYAGEHPAIIKAYFEPNLGISREAIILRHVLEHIPDPITFLSGVKKANGGKGYIYIEVPCFDWICKHRVWFDIYYEHVNYFRLQDFYRMFEKVYEAGYLFGGQYLFVVADLATFQYPEFTGEEMAELSVDFASGIHTCVDIIKNCRSSTGAPRQSAVWGGASKGVIFTLFMQRSDATVDCVIDVNPGKQGKYIGGSGLLVYAPEDALKILKPKSNIFIMNSNYFSEIITQSGNKYNYLTVNHE